MTKPELFFWNKVRLWSKHGVHIRRHHIISPFIVDFAHLPSKTIIEIYGRSHTDRDQQDKRREEFLENKGWRIVRIENDDILRNSDNVAQSVAQYLINRGIEFSSSRNQSTNHPSPPGEGQGWGQKESKRSSEDKADHPSPQGEGQGWGATNQQRLGSLLNHPALKIIAEKTKSTPYENNLNLVGGAVRDALLGRSPKNDLDIVTELDAQALAKTLDKNAQIYPRFGTAMIRVASTNIELVTARKESYDATSRKPHTEPATLLDDAKRRDFTVNTLLLNIHTGDLYDPLNSALADLESRTLRTPLDPAETFHDDPLRMLRAVRFKYQLGFDYQTPDHPSHSRTESSSSLPTGEGLREGRIQPCDELTTAISQESHRLNIISQERIRDEFTKILLGPNPDIALQELLDFGLLHSWAPELERMVGVEQGKWHYADVWNHTLHVVKNIFTDHPSPSEKRQRWGQTESNRSSEEKADHPSLLGGGQGWGVNNRTTLLLSALLHDIGKPLTRSIDEKGDTRFFDHENVGANLAYELCLRWRYSQETARDVQLLVKNHMRLSGIKTLSTPATRRIIRDLGPQLENWLALIDADANALKIGVRKLDLSTIKAKIAEVKAVQPKTNWNSPLSGQEIMQLTDLAPSPEIGKLKAELENLVIEGKIQPEDKESAKDALQIIVRNRPKP